MIAINVLLRSFSSERFSAELQKKGLIGILQNTKTKRMKINSKLSWSISASYHVKNLS